MSEKLLRFFLDELDTVRLVCSKKDCGGVIEIPMKNLSIGGITFNCPGCRAAFSAPMKEAKFTEALNLLGAAGTELARASLPFRVQFVLKDNG